MCDQTEVSYSAGDVVWVKLGPVWWPGQVQDFDKLPEEITTDFRKKPIAVVKFFQEESFEYVKNLNHIYQYNCRKKEEFIKKGLDLVRSSNSRDVPSNMNMFPNDVVMAEHLTGGNPDILADEAFLPEQKSDYKDLFGTKKYSAKKSKEPSGIKKEGDDWKLRKHSISPTGNKRLSLPALPSTIPRPITHRRFLNKALEGRSDHEVRVRIQVPPINDCDEPALVKEYKCYICGFKTVRLNVMVFHNRTHNTSFMEVELANKARLKAKEKERLSTLCKTFSEKTPSTVTSRGRVKSLPKKLKAYVDEPSPKFLKEKIPSTKKHAESTCEKSAEKSPNKTPKKEKDSSVFKSIKRPLFGKRKSAKEKAEKAAKIKLENEAMKETLLKDWDDDDVNEEEVELERLKQALESTTTSNPEEDKTTLSDNDSNFLKPIGESKKPITNIKNKIIGSKRQFTGNKSCIKTIETKVFEFDDSEDSLPVDINFRLKSQREKFTDDKFKKPKPPKPLVKALPKSKAVPFFLPPSSPENIKEGDKETAEFNEAFNNLLEETAVPILPEIPNTAVSIIKPDPIIDQTSDISSSTDPMEISEETQNFKDVVGSTKDCDDKNKNIKIECTSSDTEQIESTMLVDEAHSKVNQKNFKEVSANDPSAEMDIDLRAGVATTSIDDHSSSESGSLKTSESLAVTEISSTCDLSKTEQTNEEYQVQVESPKSSPNSKVSASEFESVNAPIEKHTDNSEIMNTSRSEEEITKSSTESETVDVPRAVKSKFSENLQSKVVHDQMKSVDILSFTSDGNYMDTEVAKEETVILQSEQPVVVAEEIVQDIPSLSAEQLELPNNATAQVISTDSDNTNLQIVLPYGSETLQCNSPQLATQAVQSVMEKIPQENQMENQMSQNLQDMELDINSMPVIIGGEDFIQPEQTNQNFIPIQPKYSESIVISPKSSPKKSESVIMHLGEPSTSNQNMQSLVSIPNRGGSANRGGKIQKTPSKTIKLSASMLKNLGLSTKCGNQVLILKTTNTAQDKQDKGGSVHKTNLPLNMIQHGSKILLVNNSQAHGQSKIKLNPQQQIFSAGKLAPGTKFFASKMVTASAAQATTSTIKDSISVSSPMPTQKLVISKGGMLGSTSKKMIINSSTGKLVPSPHTVTTSKGQAVITQSILSTKSGLMLPGSSQSATPNVKTATINLSSSQALSTSKNMIISPVTHRGDTIIAGNQKLRIVSSKAPLKGTRLVVQSSPSKMAYDSQGKGQVKFISGLKGQSSGNTILIQTSQGLVAKTICPSSTTTSASQKIVKQVDMASTVVATKSPPSKGRGKTSLVYQPKVIQSKSIQQTQIVQKPQIVQPTQTGQQPKVIKTTPVVKKVSTPRSKQTPNTTPKPQRKSSPRVPKSKVSKTAPEQVVSSNLPVIAQSSLVQGDIHQNNEVVYLTVDESGNYRQVDKSLINFEGNNPEAPQTIFIPANNPGSNLQIQDCGSLIFGLDDQGNIVNLTQPTPSTSFASDNAAPSQDILAKALANTQVLQQETIIPDSDVSLALSTSMDSTVLASSSFSDQAHYPPSLSHSVLETSLTLNQPIMTPLEVTSAVSSNFRQMSSTPANYISSNVLATNQKHLPSSMPLLTEESLAHQAGSESVFLLDGSNNIIPSTSGSQISFQLTLADNNVIMTSGTGATILPQTYQVVSSGILPSQLVAAETPECAGFQKVENVSENTLTSDGFSVVTNVSQAELMTQNPTVEKQEVLTVTESLETPGNHVNNKNLDNIEISSCESQNEDSLISGAKEESNNDIVQEHCVVAESMETIDYCPESVDESSNTQDIDTFKMEEEVKPSLKRSSNEAEIIVSLSDINDSSKKMRIDER